MEDIFKTESRLREKLIGAVDYIKREDIKKILDYFGITLRRYSLPDLNDKSGFDFKIRAIEMNKEENVRRLIEGNKLVKKYNLFPGDIFTNPEDTRQSILDYDYYILPRTKTQFDKEEAAARSGISGRMPTDPYKPKKRETESAPSLKD